MPGGPGPALWMLWMTSPGRALQSRGGGLPRVVGGEDGPMHPPEAAAVMTSMTQTTQGTFHTLEIPTTVIPGLGTVLMLTPDHATTDPGTLERMAPGLGTPNMMGGY